MKQAPWKVLIHGGAGTLSRELYSSQEISDYRAELEHILRTSGESLAKGLTAHQVCLEATALFEANPLFNAGRGSVLNERGEVECDASFMCGKLKRGAGVSGLIYQIYPSAVAYELFKANRHALLAGEGAQLFAASIKTQTLSREQFITPKRRQQWEQWNLKRDQQMLDHGGNTVGVVALDRSGNLASLTSTGGMTGKMLGRVSDSAIIGAGTYADNDTAAISCTGTGDVFIQRQTAAFVHNLILSGTSLKKATDLGLEQIRNSHGQGGLIALKQNGESVMAFNTGGMFRGSLGANSKMVIGIWDEAV